MGLDLTSDSDGSVGRMERRKRAPHLPELLLVGLLIGFVGFKTSYLGEPYYWDEAWVYAPAVHGMHDTGPSMLPDGMGTTLSRGHPLLFHFLGSLWLSTFGPSRQAAHAFVLVTAVVLLVFLYRWTASFSGKWSGLGATVMVLGNEAFLAQSGILLPETLLALFTLLTFAAYHSRKAWSFVFASSACVLTKESGVVVVVALIAWHLYALVWDRPKALRQRPLQWVAILMVPLIILSSFFVYQRVRYGWFLFPEHTGLVTWGHKDIIYKLKLCHAFLFEQNGMEVATYAFAFVVPAAWRGWNRWWFLLAGLALVTAIKVLYGRWELPLNVTIPAILISFLLYQILFLEKVRRADQMTGSIISSGLACIVAFALFSAVNFYTERYLLCLIPLIAVVFFSAMGFVLRDYPKPVFGAVALVSVLPVVFSIGQQVSIKDVNLNYTDDIHVRQRIIHLCESLDLQQRPIAGSFLEQHYLTNPLLGYLSGNSIFTDVQSSIGSDTEFAIVSEATGAMDLASAHRRGFVILNVQVSGAAWCALLGRPTTQTAAPPLMGSSLSGL